MVAISNLRWNKHKGNLHRRRLMSGAFLRVVTLDPRFSVSTVIHDK